MFRTFETTLAGRPLVIETGKMAQLANGHCLVRYGDTVVMVNVTASRSPREGVDFFPLSVDYEEKLYSVVKFRADTSSVRVSRLKRLFLQAVLSTDLSDLFSRQI